MMISAPTTRRRGKTTALALILLATLAFGASPVAAAGPNLVPDGDLRSGAGGFVPYPGRGAPAMLAWAAGGDREPGSLVVSFLDGSAGGPAWYSPEVPVAGEGAYIVQTSSRGISSELLVRFMLADGSARYRTLAKVAASSRWQRTRVRVTAPADARSLAIYQEVTGPGTLETDDYALTLATQPSLDSGIPNGDLEQDDDLTATRPLGWSGHPMSAATYSTTSGRGGGRAVKVSLSRHSAGQAPAYWETDPIPVTPGASYQFSDWYRSEVESRVYVEVQKADGSWRDLALKTVGPSRQGFTRYQTRFLVPAYAKAVSLIHVPLGKGSLTTDDYVLARVDAGSFDQATVSLTFDDGYATDTSAVAPSLEASRMRATFYPVSGLIGSPGYMTREDLGSLVAEGHEVGSHTVTHTDLSAASATRLASELRGSKSTLQGLLGPGAINGIASPYGAYDSSVLDAIGRAGYRYHRTLDEGLNEPGDWDPMRIRSYLVMSSTAPEDLQMLLSRAAADRTWLVLVWHSVEEGGDPYSVTPAQLGSQLAQIRASGARVLPVREALAVLGPQVPRTLAATARRVKARKKASSRRQATPSQLG